MKRTIRIRRQRAQYHDGYDFYDVTNDKLIDLRHSIPQDFDVTYDDPKPEPQCSVNGKPCVLYERIAALEDKVGICEHDRHTHELPERSEPPAPPTPKPVDLDALQSAISATILQLINREDWKVLMTRIDRIFKEASRET